MKLVEVQITKFRNVLNSSPVKIEQDVTCLVGKNESGKTAFLQALYRLNPARPNVSFSVLDHYPAWLEKRDRLRGEDLEEVRPIKAIFALEPQDRVALDEQFGRGALESETITLERTYKGKRWFTFETSEPHTIAHIVAGTSLPKEIASEVEKIESFEALAALIDELKGRGEEQPEAVQAATTLEGKIADTLGDNEFRKAVMEALDERIPKFFYYSDYSTLPGRVKIRELLEAEEENLTDDDLTALSLLRLAAADEDYLLNPDYERRKRELENVANALTQEVLQYWTQNPELRVEIDISQETQTNSGGQPVSVLDELKVRMRDERHMLSLPFDERSSGFRWFFSFLSAFSAYEYKNEPVIILLDEPALGLHARAQSDFLKFIDERLAAKRQIIYTTHSPFMVQPDKLERVRLVEDQGREHGSQVSDDVLSTNPDTLFPLQGALGYDLVQHLFISPHNLVVEGTSDYTYLQVVSEFLKEEGRVCLDLRWSIVPVGSADKIPTFVALLGHHLDVTVLIDSRKEGNQRLVNLAKAGYLTQKRIITVGEILNKYPADIEDLFTVGDYLRLYNRAFQKKVKISQLKGNDAIVSRIARQQGVDRFDHGRPADVLLRHRDEILPKLNKETLKRFEQLFERINETLPEE